MVVRAFDFSQFHNKNPIAGSTHIRIRQLMKYWPEFMSYRYGEKTDVMIFQKVYCSADYKFPVTCKGIKILDICDPDWMQGMTGIVETIQAMNAITCPTEAIADFIKQITDIPIVAIPDRFDVEVLPTKKRHEGKAATVVWFGYSHNAELLRPALATIQKMGLKLLVISEDDPMLNRWIDPKLYEYRKYNEETIYTDLQEADYAILPQGSRPVDRFKSNNKTIKANLAGLPVAKDLEDIERYADPTERQAFVDKHYDTLHTSYDVRRSVEQYQHLIRRLQHGNVT